MTARKKPAGRPKITALTDPQRRTLEVLHRLCTRHRVPPTIQELATAREVSIGTIQDQIRQLVAKGYVGREPHKARNLTVLKLPTEELADLIEVPILGTVAAGMPLWATENIVGHIMVEGTIARGRCFALQVTGDSMIKARIRSGDLVIVRQQPVAEHGDIVVALLDNEATVKRLAISDDTIQLLPENPRYRPLVLDPDLDFRIMGKVVAIRRQARQSSR